MAIANFKFINCQVMNFQLLLIISFMNSTFDNNLTPYKSIGNQHVDPSGAFFKKNFKIDYEINVIKIIKVAASKEIRNFNIKKKFKENLRS